MKQKIDFVHFDKETYCIHKQGESCNIGMSKCHPEDDKYQSTRTGDNIAYYRAMEKYYKEKMVNLNKELKIIKNLYTYVFPKKLIGQGIEIVKYRFDKYIQEKEATKKAYQESIASIKKSCEKYIQDKADFHKKLEKNKNN